MSSRLVQIFCTVHNVNTSYVARRRIVTSDFGARKVLRSAEQSPQPEGEDGSGPECTVSFGEKMQMWRSENEPAHSCRNDWLLLEIQGFNLTLEICAAH